LCSGGDLRAEPVATLVLILAPVAWSMGSMMARRLPQPAGLAAPAIQMIMGGLLSFAAAAARGLGMLALDACTPARRFFARRMIYGSQAIP